MRPCACCSLSLPYNWIQRHLPVETSDSAGLRMASAIWIASLRNANCTSILTWTWVSQPTQASLCLPFRLGSHSLKGSQFESQQHHTFSFSILPTLRLKWNTLGKRLILDLDRGNYSWYPQIWWNHRTRSFLLRQKTYGPIPKVCRAFSASE